MCQNCGCEPCKKCGKEVKDETCSGCQKGSEECSCKKEE